MAYGLAKRRREAARNLVKHQPHDPTSPLPDFTPTGRLPLLIAEVENLLRQRPLTAASWTGPVRARQSLRCLLTLRALWLQIRHTWLEYVDKLDSASRAVVNTNYSNMHSAMIVKARQEERDRRAIATTTSFSTETAKATLAAAAAVKKSEEIAGLLDAYYQQCVDGFFNQLPPWLELRKHCPIGGRMAYSILLACRTGKLNDNKADYHRLFGWCITGLSRVLPALELAKNSLFPALERGGTAPSCVAGRRQLNQYYCAPVPLDKAARISRVNQWLSDRTDGVCGNYYNYSPLYAVQLYRMAKAGDTSHTRGYRFLQRLQIEMDRITPPTIITGVPDRIRTVDSNGVVTDTNDYAIPACWKSGCELEQGYLYIRAGWPYVFHQAAATKPAAEEVQRQLNLSSRSYFEAKRRDLERAANTALKGDAGKEQKKLIAKHLRHLRHVEVITLKDSYEVGNCIPGTKTFCEALGISTTAISGAELAKLWRKNKYIEQQRFLPVIHAVVARYEKTLELVKLTVDPSCVGAPVVVPSVTAEFIPTGVEHVQEESGSVEGEGVVIESLEEILAEESGGPEVLAVAIAEASEGEGGDQDGASGGTSGSAGWDASQSVHPAYAGGVELGT